MIEALRFLPDHMVLDIAGGKLGEDEATKERLMEKCESHGVAHRVNYFGFLPPAQIPSFLSQADCLMLPLGNNVQSRLFTSPMKLFEYAASHVPMVVTRQPTTASLIQDGVHALMVEPNSARELARAVEALSADRTLTRNLAENAGKWVAEYAPEKRVERYGDFLGTLIKGP